MKYFTSILLLLLPLSAVAGDLEDWLIDAAEHGNMNGVNQMLSRGDCCWG